MPRKIVNRYPIINKIISFRTISLVLFISTLHCASTYTRQEFINDVKTKEIEKLKDHVNSDFLRIETVDYRIGSPENIDNIFKLYDFCEKFATKTLQDRKIQENSDNFSDAFNKMESNCKPLLTTAKILANPNDPRNINRDIAFQIYALILPNSIFLQTMEKLQNRKETLEQEAIMRQRELERQRAEEAELIRKNHEKAMKILIKRLSKKYKIDPDFPEKESLIITDAVPVGHIYIYNCYIYTQVRPNIYFGKCNEWPHYILSQTDLEKGSDIVLVGKFDSYGNHVFRSVLPVVKVLEIIK